MTTPQFARRLLKSTRTFEDNKGGTEDSWSLCDLGEADTGTIQGQKEMEFYHSQGEVLGQIVEKVWESFFVGSERLMLMKRKTTCITVYIKYCSNGDGSFISPTSGGERQCVGNSTFQQGSDAQQLYICQPGFVVLAPPHVLLWLMKEAGK